MDDDMKKALQEIMKRVTRTESKVSRMMELAGINPRLASIDVRVICAPAADDRVSVNVTSMSVPLGEVLAVAREANADAKFIYVNHGGNVVTLSL